LADVPDPAADPDWVRRLNFSGGDRRAVARLADTLIDRGARTCAHLIRGTHRFAADPVEGPVADRTVYLAGSIARHPRLVSKLEAALRERSGTANFPLRLLDAASLAGHPDADLTLAGAALAGMTPRTDP
jgi:hypothetical protein